VLSTEGYQDHEIWLPSNEKHRTVLIRRQTITLFCHNRRVCQTDRQRERQTAGRQK